MSEPPASQVAAAQSPERAGRSLAALFAGWIGGSIGRSRTEWEAQASAPGNASSLNAGPLQAVLDRLPDAVLAVEGRRQEGGAGLTVTIVNAAARGTLPLAAEVGARLTGAIRHPDVLAAAEASAFDAVSRTLTFQGGGAQPRDWRVWTEPLPSAADKASALLIFRDETSARRLERMRVDFLANASHELRTPLASLTGFIETLRGHARDDASARERFLGIMAAQADRMRRLVDDLLSLSRIELNEHLPPSEGCDLSWIVREGVDALSPLVLDKGLHLETNGLPDRLPLTGDRDQLSQIVQNLIENAAKYARSRVTVTCAPEVGFESTEATALSRPAGAAASHRLPLLSPDRPHAGRFALLIVRDDGRGIEREHLPRLAERFFRAPGQKTSRTPGTGLGLAIVKHIVNRHRGGLVVDSAPGEGVAFAVYLPLAPGAALPSSEPPAVTGLSPNRHAPSASGVQDTSLEGAPTHDRTHAPILRRRA